MTKAFREKLKKFRTNINLGRTLRLVWSITNRQMVWVLFLILIENIFFLLSLYVFKSLVNAVAAPNAVNKFETVTKYLALSGLFTISFLIIKTVINLVSEKQSVKVSEYIDDKIHASAIDLDLGFYESPAYFDTMKRAKDAGPDKANAILINLVDILKNGVTMLLLGSVLISINALLLPLLVLFILPTLIVRIQYADRYYKWRRAQTPLERKSSYLSSLITEEVNAKEVKAFGLGNYFRSLYKAIRIDLISQRLKMARKNAINEIITSILAVSGLFVCIGYICLRAVEGNTTVGDITLFLVIFPQLFAVMQSLSGGISTLYQNSIFINNLFELFDLRSNFPEPEQPLSVPQNDEADLEIENIYFTYPHAAETTLDDVSMKIPAGKIIAIVGLNGAGKTTLIKLLARLYDPLAGEIKFGGVDIRNFKSAEYRKQISVVFQDFGKYNMSVADNIRFGNIDGMISEEKIKISALKSGAHEFIKKFPAGYQTTMGRIFEDGHEVSIGQWQKLAIARAFYSDSKFLIFDEATSALDAKSEQEIFESLRQHIGNRGILVISHRLSAVKHADHIYVMAEGKIKQHGTHEELIAVPGEYSKLFTKKTVVV
jgi:ATP-binding cassette subfamily B protein